MCNYVFCVFLTSLVISCYTLLKGSINWLLLLYYYYYYLKTINKRRYWYVFRIHLFKEIHLIFWNIALLTSGVLKKLIVCFTRCTLFFQYVCFLLPICLPCVSSETYCNEDECCVVTHRVADIRVASRLTFVRIACLLQLWIKTSDLFRRRQNKKTRNKRLATWRRTRSKSFVYSYN